MDVQGRRIRQIFLYTESVNNKPKTFCSTKRRFMGKCDETMYNYLVFAQQLIFT